MWYRPSAVLAVMTLGLSGAVAAPAGAVPVRYTFGGTLGLSSGSDSLSLDGAEIQLVALADTSDAPATGYVGACFDAGVYTPSSLTATFSGRPGGAPDETVAFSAQLWSENSVCFYDALQLRDGSATLALSQVEVRIPVFEVGFDLSFFPPALGIPPLPIFGSSDIASIAAGVLQDAGGGSLFRYTVQSPSAMVEVIPEPGTAWLLALGLLALARSGARARHIGGIE